MEEWRAAGAAFLLIVALGVPGASAQPRERFTEALGELTSAVDGTDGDEGPRITAAIDAMAVSLSAWDEAVATVEARFARELQNASPDTQAQLHASLAVVYLDRGRLADARRELATSVRLNPKNPDVHALRSRVAAVAGTPDERVAAAAQAWQLTPSDLSLAAVLLAADPDGPGTDVRTAFAAVRGARNRLLQARAPGAPPFLALSLVDDAAASQPVLVPSLYARGYGLIQNGDYAQALVQLRLAASRDPLVADAALRVPAVLTGIAALRASDTDAARRLLADSVAASPTSSTLHRLLGSALRAAGQRPEAIEHLSTAVRLAAADDRAGIALADLHLDGRDADAAERVLLELVRVQPQSGRAHFRLGVLYQTQRREAEALRAFEAAAVSAPLAGAGRLQVTIGRLRENQLDAEGAEQAFRQALRINPNDAVAHRERGDVLRAGGRADASLAEFLTTLLIDPLDADAWTAIGQADAAAGRDAEALAPLERAIELNPRQREAHYARAQALLRLGRDADGRAALEAFRRLQAEAMELERRSYRGALARD